MPVRRPLALLLIAALALATPRTAAAICSAAELIGSAAEPACPVGTGDCLIAGNYTVETGCTFDFGNRKVLISGKLTVGTRTMTLRARSFVLSPSGFIDGIGNGQGARGGLVRIETTGAGINGLLQTTTSSTIDVSGNLSGGDIELRSAGNSSLSGKLFADGLNALASGGTIDVSASGNLDTTSSSKLSATGGLDSDGGGEIDLLAGGHVILASDLLVGGYDGGYIDIRAGTTVDMLGANASALTGSDAGSGGCVEVLGMAGTTVRGRIEANGVSGEFMTGGCGGLICIDGDAGDLVIAAPALIIANGGAPDGGGGQIALMALRNAVVNGDVEARGPEDGETCGGDICIEAGLDVTVAGTSDLDASGGDAGGQVEAFAGRHVTLLGPVQADGRRGGSFGGDVAARAGVGGAGNLNLDARVDATSLPSCSVENGCGSGGLTDFDGCNVTLGGNARLLVGGPEAGENNVTAREQMTLAAGSRLDAKGTSATPVDGANRLLHRATRPAIKMGVVLPAATDLALTTCPNEGQTMPRCLVPCPTCGNGVQEFPEACDPGLMPPLSCQANGCSVFCQLENCDDGRVCTGDSCFTEFGCRHVVTPVCTEPPTPTATITGTLPTGTATRTATPTPSVTETRTASPTASATPTATSTATPTATPSLTATASVTPTPLVTPTSSASPSHTASSTSTATPTGTATPTSSATPSASASPTSADTATATATPTSTPPATDTVAPATATPPPSACAGDCSGDGSVTVNELITGVNIALGNTPASSCPAFDRNGDGEVSINELIAAVNAALNGC